MLSIVVYPKCGTCRNAVKWLNENQIEFTQRHILDESLSVEEIREIHVKSGLPIKRLFNTSGMKYRELALKDKIDEMSDAECYALLATDGMLVKRPLAYKPSGQITLGFKVNEYEEMWK